MPPGVTECGSSVRSTRQGSLVHICGQVDDWWPGHGSLVIAVGFACPARSHRNADPRRHPDRSTRHGTVRPVRIARDSRRIHRAEIGETRRPPGDRHRHAPAATRRTVVAHRSVWTTTDTWLAEVRSPLPQRSGSTNPRMDDTIREARRSVAVTPLKSHPLWAALRGGWSCTHCEPRGWMIWWRYVNR